MDAGFPRELRGRGVRPLVINIKNRLKAVSCALLVLVLLWGGPARARFFV